MTAPDDEPRSPGSDRKGPGRLVLVFRVLLLVLAAGSAMVALTIGLRDRAAPDSGARYACPMHPEVTSAVPAQCPICRMDLERLETSGAGNAAAIDPSTYLSYDIMRRRGTGPDAPAPAWVESSGDISAVLSNDELVGLTGDARGLFYASTSPNVAIHVRAMDGTVESWDASTSRLRFRVDPTGGPLDRALAPREVGRIRLVDKAREQPVVPYAAILESAEGPYVLVASPDGRSLARRPIVIGKVFGGMAFVLSGVGPHERLLTRSVFFVDAERKLRRQQDIEVKR